MRRPATPSPPRTGRPTAVVRRPLLNREARGLRDDDLRRDVGARREHGRRQPRSGLPRHRRSGGGDRGGARGDLVGSEPVRPGHRRRGAPEGDRRPPAALLRARLRPDREVLVTTGATEAIAATILALCEPGDSVVSFEPYYDSYGASIALAGAEHRVVPLRPPRWSFDLEQLAEAVTDRTRLVLVNSPAQPDRQGVRARRAGGDRRSSASSATSSPSPTRFTSISSSRASTSRWRRFPACAIER